MASSQIPNSVSVETLLEIMNKNTTNDKTPESLQNATPDEMKDAAVETVEELCARIQSPFGYKLIADYCLYQLYYLHNSAFDEYFEKDQKMTALCWARDAGHLQVLIKTLRDINCGSADFIDSSSSTSDED